MLYRAVLITVAAFLVNCSGFSGSTSSTSSTSSGLCSQGSVVPSGQIQLLAGQIGGPGYIDAIGVAARFNRPIALQFDSSGNLYVSDNNNQLIRRIDTSASVTTFAGTYGTSGSTDGAALAAQFNSPRGFAIDSLGNLFVADSGNHTIRKITSSGTVSTFAGQAGSLGTADGTGSAARFNLPTSIAIDSSDNLYITDLNAQTIRKVTPTAVVTTFAGTAGSSGSTDGMGSAARFHSPSGITIDASNRLYVADSYNETIRMIATDSTVSTIAGTASAYGSVDGTGSSARFQNPTDLVSDAVGNLFVVDAGNRTIRTVSSGGVVSTLVGTAGVSGDADGVGSAASFSSIEGIARDPAGNLFVGDGIVMIRKITPGGVVTTYAGTPAHVGQANGVGNQASFLGLSSLVVDSCGTVFAAEPAANVIRKITRDGVVTVFAGTSGSSGTTDGQGSLARFHTPSGLAIDASDTIYVADTANDTIRKITPQGLVTTLAGSPGVAGYVDDTGSAARFSGPGRIAADPSGTVYLLDGQSTIRKITPAGLVTTLAGNQGVTGSADGTGTAATFYAPQGITIDASGNIIVADTFNSIIRQVTPAGVVTTIAGLAGAQPAVVNGSQAAARFSYPFYIAADKVGNIYVSEYSTDVRKISGGMVTTVVGDSVHSGMSLGPLPGAVTNALTPIALSNSTLFVYGENAIVQCQKP